MAYKILAINPGSTSTKAALYEDDKPVVELTLRHSVEEIGQFANIIDQMGTDEFYRVKVGVGEKPSGWDLAARRRGEGPALTVEEAESHLISCCSFPPLCPSSSPAVPVVIESSVWKGPGGFSL